MRFVHSAILLIGIGCFGIGLSSVMYYIGGKGYRTGWVGETPMAFSTSLVVMFIGVALYLTGKSLIRHDKIIRQI